mgnify:FL=1
MPLDNVAQFSFEHLPQHVHVRFEKPFTVVSSAVLNGGMVQASHIVNRNVPLTMDSPERPEESLARYCCDHGWQGKAVGMMTAASMDSFVMKEETHQGVSIAVLVTAGLSNARRVGDPAEYRQMSDEPDELGTINIIVITTATLIPAAMIESLLIVTEAKVAALQKANILSPISNEVATGTVTDSVAVASANEASRVAFCGKHVLFVEVLGRLVFEAVLESMQWEFYAQNSVESMD